MHLDYPVAQAAAELICGAISNGLPTEDAAESYGLDKIEGRRLEDVLDELLPGDLIDALRTAAGRLDESDYDDADDDDDDKDAEVPA